MERGRRGRIEEVVAETDHAATLVIRPGWGWHYNHRPGQYVGIGVQVNGRFQWRSYPVRRAPAQGAHDLDHPCGPCRRGCSRPTPVMSMLPALDRRGTFTESGPDVVMLGTTSVCSAGLGRPIAFLGSDEEAGGMAFHFPPSHLECAEAPLQAYDGVDAAVLGQPRPVEQRVPATTSGSSSSTPGVRTSTTGRRSSRARCSTS